MILLVENMGCDVQQNLAHPCCSPDEAVADCFGRVIVMEVVEESASHSFACHDSSEVAQDPESLCGLRDGLKQKPARQNIDL